MPLCLGNLVYLSYALIRMHGDLKKYDGSPQKPGGKTEQTPSQPDNSARGNLRNLCDADKQNMSRQMGIVPFADGCGLKPEELSELSRRVEKPLMSFGGARAICDFFRRLLHLGGPPTYQRPGSPTPRQRCPT